MNKSSIFKNLEDPLGVLRKGAEELKIFLNEGQIKSFALYLKELNVWNKRINLIGRRNDHEIVIKDFLDSLMISKYLPLASTLLDIGSGAGFPGIPIRISRQDLEVGLLEIREKRVSFLKHMIRLLRFKDLGVISAGDARFKNHFDFSVSRAFGATSKFADVAEPYLVKGGIVLAMKGKKGEEELRQECSLLEKKGWGIAFKDRMPLPIVGHERVIFGLKKIVSRETSL